MDKTMQQQLKDAERSVVEAEKEFGPEHPELAERLQKYANLLAQTEGRKLDAVNIEARAKAIRAKMYAKEAEIEHAKISTVLIKPKQTSTTPPGGYIGLLGMMLAGVSLFVDQNMMPILAVLSVVLVVFDVVTTRGAGWWRALLAGVFLGSAYMCAQSLPATMLTDASPMERFNYSSENPDVVQNVAKLTEAATARNYSFLLPPDFASLDLNKMEWGESYEWRTAERADGTFGEFRLLLMQPQAVAKNYGTYSLMRMTTDVAMPKIVSELGLDMPDVTQTKPKIEEINGIDFERVDFQAKSGEHTKAGVAYISKQPDGLLMIVGADWQPDSVQSLSLMEAIVYTIKRTPGAAIGPKVDAPETSNDESTTDGASPDAAPAPDSSSQTGDAPAQ